MKNKHLLAAIVLATCAVFFSADLWNAWKSSESRVGVIPLPAGVTGPESLAFDPDGEGPYTGVSDGRILKWQGQELGWNEYAAVAPEALSEECKGKHRMETEHLCGRPLGLQFNKMTRELYIADAYFGLLKVGHGDSIATPVATLAEGVPLHFTNSLDIAQDNGIIYFTDSSMRFRRREFMSAVLSGDKSGRVMRYAPETKEVNVLQSGLSFPNGIVLSPDGTFLLIAESTTCRILRYWLHPKNSTAEVLIQLPGFPDNIKPSPRGGFWVAIHKRRGKLLEWLLNSPFWLRKTLLWLPIDNGRIFTLLGKWLGNSLALRISAEGEVLEVLEYFDGKKAYISEVGEQNGTLWIGSVLMPYVGMHKL